MLNQATRMGLTEGVAAITTAARIADCQGLAPMQLSHPQVAAAAVQLPLSSRICRGHQHLAQEAVGLLQKLLVQIHP